MLKPSVFEFTKYTFQPSQKRVVFTYTQHFSNAESIVFQETIILPQIPNTKDIDENLLNNTLQALHLILGVSYYKFYCSKKIKHPYHISKKEADFWNTIYKNGLGEFYFRNKLDPKNSPKFSFSKTSNRSPSTSLRANKTPKVLLGFSGGKDSIVAAELLKEQGINFDGLFIENNRSIPLVDITAKKANINLFKITRHLDEKVFQKYPYNGHIPISAIFGFLGVFYSILYGYSYFTVANEFSSSFGNVKYKGLNVNHQWSKSLEFENVFREYIKNYISQDIGYFSLLRPFFEIRVAKMFAKYSKYFPLFAGCNKNFTLTKESGGVERKIWCGQCAKCVFTFMLLSPFLTKEELIHIFQKNLYEDEGLLPLFKDILGIGNMKPFDCIGTFEESQVAFVLGSKKFKNDFIIKNLLGKINVRAEEIESLLRTKYDTHAPDYLKFLGMNNVLILGYGKEGKVSEQYIKKYWSNLKIKISDDTIKNQHNFDVAIKTPGINRSLVKIPYTTATNIFFSKIKELGNITIGITGSKGKSTTTSLIYEILKKAGRRAVLLGNIGNPMLEILLKPIKKNEIFVIELSSYQLDDITYSPHIAVVTSLFPEHMDYHGNLKNYYEAKKNIFRFQSGNDHLVYCVKAKNAYETSLLGQHNQNNIEAAAQVARILNIPETIIKKVVKTFKSLPHRLESVGTFKGITFYDDAISTTPESTIEAIKSLKNVDTIFLGGEDRGYNFSQLEKTVKKYKIRNVVLFPESGNRIGETLRHSSGQNLRILKTKSMEEAVAFAYQYTKPGKICLLSCASPSYSLWKNFEEKGNEFKKIVKSHK